MNQISVRWSLFLLGLLLTACRPTSLDPAAYMAWVSDPQHGLHSIRQIGDYQLDLQLLPPSYQALRQTEGRPNSALIRAMEADMAESLDFELRLRPAQSSQPLLKHKISSPQHYQERVQYLAFEMEKHLQLVIGTDTLRPLIYHFERAFDLKPAVTCLLSFERPEVLPATAQLILDDQAFGMGPVHFRLSFAELTALPALKY